MEIISIDDLHDKFEELGENDLILDVRSPSEFQSGHIIGARNKDHESVTDIVDELKEHSKVYVHCKMGGRSLKAVEFLKSQGFKYCKSVAGGINAWSDEIDSSVPHY